MSLDPVLAAHLSLLDGIALETAMADDSVLDRLREAIPAPPLPAVDVHEETVAGPHGPVPVRIYTPQDAVSGRPALVWMHGGGWVAGDLDQPEADYVSRYICASAGAVVVSVDYRLALDGVHFPVPLDDTVAAAEWVRADAARLGVDADRLFIGGASAGANLAAGAVVRLRDSSRPLPAGVLLVYPLLHTSVPPLAPDVETAMAELPVVMRIPADVVGQVCANYLGGSVDDPDPCAFPGYADLTGFPPTVVLVSEYDDLRPSGETFAADLRAAGVDIQLVVEAGVPHGHLDWPGLEGTERSLALLAAKVANVDP